MLISSKGAAPPVAPLGNLTANEEMVYGNFHEGNTSTEELR